MVAAVALVLLAVLPGVVGVAAAEPATTIVNNGPPENRLDLAIVGDGYTAGEMTKYHDDAARVAQAMFQQEPLREYASYFNVHRIDVASNQSGSDHPDRSPPVFVDTAFDSSYGCAGIQRLICVSTSKTFDVFYRSLNPAQIDLQLVIVNDPEYGGSGGTPAVASTNSAVIELVLHELGHSFGGLTDEYGGGVGCVPGEPLEPNATAATTRESAKWNAWIEPTTPVPTGGFTPGLVGLYQGARYCDTGLYRPTLDSKMRSLGRPFEQVNTEELVKRIYNRISPIDDWSPLQPEIAWVSGASQTFTVTPLVPRSHALDVSWQLDGAPVATGPLLTLAFDGLRPGTHLVRAVVTDRTTWVRTDGHGIMTDTRQWFVQVPSAGGSFRPLPPTRVLDTRVGPGPVGALGPGGTLDVQIAGTAGVPLEGAEAVVFNVTAVDPSAGGYLTVHPTGSPQPNASNLNFGAGEVVPNLVEVLLGTGGRVRLFNGSPGSTHYIVDVVGWVTNDAGATGPAGRYRPLVPVRLLDTRGPPSAPMRPGAGADLPLQVTGQRTVPAAGVAAVVLNVTVTDVLGGGGWLTVHPSGTPPPLASNLNFVAGQTVPNRVIVAVGPDGRVGLHLGGAASSAHVVVDVAGWFGDASAPAGGSLFSGLGPVRIADTRPVDGLSVAAPVGPAQTMAVQVAGTPGVPTMGGPGAPTAAVLNVTVTQTTSTGYLTVFPSDAAQPLASDQNWVPGATRANLVVATLGSDGKVKIFNSAGSTHVIVDVLGYYAEPGAAPPR